MKQITLVGNCHINTLASLLQKCTDPGQLSVEKVQLARPISLEREKIQKLKKSDYIGIVSTSVDEFSQYLSTNSIFPKGSRPQQIVIPHVRARRFHPDVIYLADKKKKNILSPMGRPHSAIALYSYLNHLSASEARELYCEVVYRRFKYYEIPKADHNWLVNQEQATGFELLHMEKDWLSRGCYLHSPNHPSTIAFSSLAIELAQRISVDLVHSTPEILVSDRAASEGIWPVYPDIAEVNGVIGGFRFRLPQSKQKDAEPTYMQLEEFIEASYEVYKNSQLSDFHSPEYHRKVTDTRIEDILSEIKSEQAASKIFNPYKNLPAEKYWRRSISTVQPSEVDPVVTAKFTISKKDKVATAGSCFAQHISKKLSSSGFTWLEAETAPRNYSKDEASKLGYGVFSARYGNIYSARQLLQLFNAAMGTSEVDRTPWFNARNQKYIDPVRPYIHDNGFDTREEYQTDLDAHLQSVKEMFNNLDIFVFTLGLTEAWERASDGLIAPFHPGVLGVESENSDFIFKNFTVDEVISDMEEFKKKLFEINPTAKMMLTVSPVPLIATFGQKHVLSQTTYSKSVLRVAAEKISSDPRIAYFPSYEIVSSHYNGGKYFAEDKREVRPEGVAHVMRLLLQHYTVEEAALDSTDVEEAAVLCDEENLDNQKKFA